jgi:hypothetical protein
MTLEQSQTAEATESQARFSAEEVREILSIASNLQESTFSAEQVRAIARDSGIADENLERAFELYRQRRAVEEQRKRKAAVRKRWLTLIATVVAATIGFAGALTYTATQVEQATTKVERQLLAASPTCSVYLEARESWGSPREKRLIIQLSNGQVFVLDDFFSAMLVSHRFPIWQVCCFQGLAVHLSCHARGEVLPHQDTPLSTQAQSE